MIITRLAGGLGNQMFQYAAALAVADRHRTGVKLDLSYFERFESSVAHNKYALDCWNIIEQFATADELERLGCTHFNVLGKVSIAGTRMLGLHGISKRLDGTKHSRSVGPLRARLLRRAILSPHHRWHTQPTFRYYPGFEHIENDFYLEGLFQSERFFSSVADQLRLHFTFRYPPTPKVAEVARRIMNEGPSVAIHIRRGDYISNPIYAKMCGAISVEYYHRSIRLLKERMPDLALYIFSDDIDTIARELSLEDPHHFVHGIEPWHAYDTIRLMSMCQHQIIANSTFSWWAAWLNSFPEKVVIAPDPWFVDDTYDAADIAPPTWLRIPRS